MKLFRIFYFFLVIIFSGEAAFSQNEGIPLSRLSTEIKQAHPGDTIFIIPGIYSNIIIPVKKKFSENVVIRPKVYGSVLITGGLTFRMIGCLNIKFEGFYFQRTTGSTFIINNSKQINIYNNYFSQCGDDPNHSIIRIVNGSSDNVINYNTFNDNRSQGILIATYANNPNDQFNTGNQIFRNHFSNIQAVNAIYPNKGRNGMECIVIGFGSDKTLNYALNTKVYQNLFDNIIGDGWEIISNKTSHNIISENTFLNNRSGISIRSGNYNQIINNYMDSTTKGIRLFGKGQKVENNFIINSNVGIRFPSADFTSKDTGSFIGYYQGDSSVITNNFIINAKEIPILIDEGNRKLQPENLSFSNNYIFAKVNINTLQNVFRSTSISTSEKNQIFSGEFPNSTINEYMKLWYSRINDDKKHWPFKNGDSDIGKSW